MWFGRAKLLLLTAAACTTGASASQEREPAALPKHITPPAAAAIGRGLAFLVRCQAPDGSWRSGVGGDQYPTAMTSLAGTALLANGNTTTQGRYAPQVYRAVNYLLRNSHESGLIAAKEQEGRSCMHGHGFAMLFLGQAYGMTEDAETQERLRQALQRAVRLTASSQSRAGGWYYKPESRSDEGSVTVTQIQGFRSCRNAGIAVPKATIDQAMEYLAKSANPDGGIRYRAGQGGNSRPAITAAAVACWYNAGEYDNPLAKKALEFSKRTVGVSGGGGHYFYAQLYMAQVMYLSGDESWDWYFPKMRDRLLELQAPDGSWQGDNVGKVYGTAIALIILQLPYNYMPIMQR